MLIQTFNIRCRTCIQPLVVTASGYIGCPNMHTRLFLYADLQEFVKSYHGLLTEGEASSIMSQLIYEEQ